MAKRAAADEKQERAHRATEEFYHQQQVEHEHQVQEQRKSEKKKSYAASVHEHKGHAHGTYVSAFCAVQDFWMNVTLAHRSFYRLCCHNLTLLS